MKSRNRKNKDRKNPALDADAADRYGAIADAARLAQLKAGWDHAMKRVSKGARSKGGVKLLAIWDVAFSRGRRA